VVLFDKGALGVVHLAGDVKLTIFILAAALDLPVEA
jgi:hypothetical protein